MLQTKKKQSYIIYSAVLQKRASSFATRLVPVGERSRRCRIAARFFFFFGVITGDNLGEEAVMQVAGGLFNCPRSRGRGTFPSRPN